MSISDQLVIIDAGVVEQVGSPREAYTKLANRFVADFIGKANFVPATVVGADAIEVAGVRIELADKTSVPSGSRVTVVIRAVSPARCAERCSWVAEYVVDVGEAGECSWESPIGVKLDSSTPVARSS